MAGLLGRLFGARRERGGMDVRSAGSEARCFHDRDMRSKDGHWPGFFATTNGMTIYSFHTVNHGFARVLHALEKATADMRIGETLEVAGLQITSVGRDTIVDATVTKRDLVVTNNSGQKAVIELGELLDDWKTGEVTASHMLKLVGHFSLRVSERHKGGARTVSGVPCPKAYHRYVAFFDMFRSLVTEFESLGNPCEDDYDRACLCLVEADGGLPGMVCLNEHKRMLAEVAGVYMKRAATLVPQIQERMVQSGFSFGSRRLIYKDKSFFAMEATADTDGGFVVRDRTRSGPEMYFEVERSRAGYTRLIISDGFSLSNSRIVFDMRTASCTLMRDLEGADDIERALRLLDEAREVFCTRRVDYENYSDFLVSNDFSAYETSRGMGHQSPSQDKAA